MDDSLLSSAMKLRGGTIRSKMLVEGRLVRQNRFRRVSVDGTCVVLMDASRDARGESGAGCRRGRTTPENGYDLGPGYLMRIVARTGVSL